MNILFIGDISGRLGRRAVTEVLPEIIKKHKVDLVIANIENASSGDGVSVKAYDELRALPIDIFTSGNHIWQKREIYPTLEDKNELILRPINYPDGTIGRGVWTKEIGTTKVAVVNVIGRIFMKEGIDDPFRATEKVLSELKNHVVIVDFHAEATSEKRAFGFFLDGKVAAVLGTHTHVPTADEQILPEGTAYISDVGFVGAHQSVLGVDKDIIVHNFMVKPNEIYEMGKGEAEFNAVLIETNGLKAKSISRIREMV
ncbi:MAG: TIGR00282 family metallophosphoesterase [Patescibacteria group bacterium]|jgi:hypothetical protein